MAMASAVTAAMVKVFAMVLRFMMYLLELFKWWPIRLTCHE
jgi:hypothetical protein